MGVSLLTEACPAVLEEGGVSLLTEACSAVLEEGGVTAD